MTNAILILSIIMIANADQQPPEPVKPEPAAEAKPQAPPPVVIPNLPPKEKLTPLEEKLDAPLRGLVRAVKSGGPAAVKKTAEEQAIPLDQDRVAVRVIAKRRRDVSFLKRRLLHLGGAYTTTFQDSVYGKLPVQNIETMANEAKVVKLSADLPIAHPLQQPDPKIAGKK